MSIVIVGAGPNLGAAVARRFGRAGLPGVHLGHTAIGGRIAPGADHEPDDMAEVLWRHHTDRSMFQTKLGID